MHEKIELILGDITKVEVDAVVNAAKNSLLGGGGVDGAIHKAAGPELLAKCKTLSGCPTGHAVLTDAYDMPSRFIIHTVGPIWQGGDNKESVFLAQSYNNCLRIASENNCKSIAFPNISTGVYHFPKALAAEIAISQVSNFLNENEHFEKVIFVCFGEENFNIYKKLLKH